MHSTLLAKKKELTIQGSLVLYIAITVAGVGVLISCFDWAFDSLTGRLPVFADDIQGTSKYISMMLRGLLLSSLHFFILYHMRVLAEKQKHSIEIAQLKQDHLEANLSSLKEQLSPHFLFNTLNTLSTLTQEATVKQYVDELANVYRYMLMYKKMDTATLGQELEFTESYLYIIKTRMEEAIAITIQVDEQFWKTLLAPFTLQLLIENAIKHNVASVSRKLDIRIYTEHDQYLVVSNNLQLKYTIPQSAGIGLNNIMRRYRLLFNQDIHIERTVSTFTVKLPIIRP